MKPRISIKKDYILVEPQVYDFQALIAAVTSLGKNVIWLFGEGYLNISFQDLYKINSYAWKNLDLLINKTFFQSHCAFFQTPDIHDIYMVYHHDSQ